MNKRASVLVALVLVGGCQTAPPVEEMIWIRTDGHPLADDPTYYQTKFEIDRIVCVGKAPKSGVGVSQIYYQGLSGTINAQMYRDGRGKTVLDLMKECMAGKGYVLVPKSSAEATSAAFRKQHAKP